MLLRVRLGAVDGADQGISGPERRRRWSDEDQLQILTEAFASGVVEIPHRIEDKDTTQKNVKKMLDRLAGLTNLGFDPDSEAAAQSRPSFRDLMAFTFQPQNIVANPDVMFFKADTSEHRDKLKTIFPYILQAVTADVLQARHELDRLNRLLRRREADLRALVTAGNAWRLEATSWLRQAIEFGLLPPDQIIPTEWPDVVDLLRGVVAANSEAAHPTIAGIDAALVRLKELRDEETKVAGELTQRRQRLTELRRLIESSDAYPRHPLYVRGDQVFEDFA